MSEHVAIAIISALIGIILGGASNNFFVSEPLKRKVDNLAERLASLEATVLGLAQDRRQHPRHT